MNATNLAIGTVVGMLLYGLVLALISKWAAQRTHGKTSEYFVAGRSLPWYVMLGTFFLTMWSGASLYGNTAAFYRLGIGYLSGCSGNYFLGIIAPAIVYPIWLLGKRFNIVSPAGLLTYRYKSRVITLICSAVFILCSIPLIATNIIAFGNCVNVTTGGKIAFAVAAAFMIVYVFAHIIKGGNTSVAYADCFAGIMAVVGLTVVIATLIKNVVMPAGGFAAATAAIQAENSDLLIHSGNFAKGFQTAGIAISASMSSFIWPHVLMRSYMAKNVGSFKMQAMLIPPLVWFTYTVFAFCGIFLGHTGFPGLDGVTAENIMPMLLTTYAPLIVCVWYVLVVFAFAISTADSLAVSSTSVLQIDVMESDGEMVDKSKLHFGILAIAVGVTLCVIFRPKFLVTYMYSFCNPGFFAMAPAMIGGMFWRKGSRTGAFASIIVGFAVVCYVLFVYNPIPSCNPILWGTAASLPTYIIVSLLTKQSPEEAVAAEEMTGYIADTFRGRNNGAFALMIVISVILFIFDMWGVPKIGTAYDMLAGWIPLQVVLHLCVALCMTVVGYFCCQNRFGNQADESRLRSDT